MTKRLLLVPLLATSFLPFLVACAEKTNPDAKTADNPSPAASASGDSSSSSFTLCEGTYALCTTAKCTYVPGPEKPGVAPLLNCPCSVQTDYSVGQNACDTVPKVTPKVGLSISSRYHPITSMAICSNDRPWAWCLDKPCTVNEGPNNTLIANCLCDQVSTPKKNYVIVTESFSESTCTTDIWSSAAPSDIIDIMKFLAASKEQQMKVPPITIIGVGVTKK